MPNVPERSFTDTQFIGIMVTGSQTSSQKAGNPSIVPAAIDYQWPVAPNTITDDAVKTGCASETDGGQYPEQFSLEAIERLQKRNTDPDIPYDEDDDLA